MPFESPWVLEKAETEWEEETILGLHKLQKSHETI